MNKLVLTGGGAAAGARRGRPKGAKNKRSGDLQRYVEARYAGLTPGQQAAAVGLVDAAELRAAGGDLLGAMVVKARRLALALDCEPKEAWLLMLKEREALLPYIHQRMPNKADPAAAQDGPVFVTVPIEAVPMAGGRGATEGEWDVPADMVQNQGLSQGDLGQVSRGQVSREPQSQAGQEIEGDAPTDG